MSSQPILLSSLKKDQHDDMDSLSPAVEFVSWVCITVENSTNSPSVLMSLCKDGKTSSVA